MSDAAGKLDGIRDIVAPRLPQETDLTGLWVALIACIIMLVLAWWVWKKRQQPLARARRLFRHVQLADTDDDRLLGQGLIDIIRLVTLTHNLDARHCPDNTIGLNDSEWGSLLDTCYQLRYSSSGVSAVDRDNVIKLTSRLLWPPR